MLLLDTTTVTATGRGPGVQISYQNSIWAEFFLNVTAAATAAADTLDVYIQASPDLGTTWDDMVHFTQVLGNGGAKSFLARWQSQIAPTTAMAAPQDAGLSAGVAQGPHSLYWAVKYVVVNNTAPSFTLKVTASGNISSART